MTVRTKQLVGAACLLECINVARGDGGRNMILNPHSLKLNHTAVIRKQCSSVLQLLNDSDCCYLGTHVQVTHLWRIMRQLPQNEAKCKLQLQDVST